MARRTAGERIGDAIAGHAGRLWFVVAHAVWFAVWIALSGGKIPGVRAIDPFPYSFLTFMLAIESIFLSLFILMSQNRANKQADSRSHLDLQINLLAEQEANRGVTDATQALRVPWPEDRRRRRSCGEAQEDNQSGDSARRD